MELLSEGRGISWRLDERVIFFIVLAASLLIRLINIDIPLLEAADVRQIQTASISRFFYHNGIDILRSKLDFMPGNTGYLILEFPLYNILLAAFYMLSGGVHEWIGRLLSIFFFTGSGIFVFLILRQLYDFRTALIGLIVYNLSPLGIIFSRAVMPDSEMLFFSTGAVYFLLYFVNSDKRWCFWLSSLFAMTALLVKIQSFHIFLPLFFLIFYRQKFKCFIDYRNYLFALIASMPAVLWYARSALTCAVVSPDRTKLFQVANWFDPSLFLTPGLYKDLLGITSGFLLTPVGFALFLLGLTVRVRQRIELVCFAWLGGVALYLFAFNALLWEPYYYLSVLPVASIFIARVFLARWSEPLKTTYLSAKAGKVLAVVVLALLIGRYALYAYVLPAGFKLVPEATEAMRDVSDPADMVVIGGHLVGSEMLYYSRRKGWVLQLPEGKEQDGPRLINDLLDGYKDKGARYFLYTGGGVLSPELLREYLDKKYEPVRYEKDKYVIYRLE